MGFRGAPCLPIVDAASVTGIRSSSLNWLALLYLGFCLLCCKPEVIRVPSPDLLRLNQMFT